MSHTILHVTLVRTGKHNLSIGERVYGKINNVGYLVKDMLKLGFYVRSVCFVMISLGFTRRDLVSDSECLGLTFV